MTTTEIISILTFLSIIVGGVFALYKWNMNMRLKRAEYIKHLFDEIRTNPSIHFYVFEYNEHWYDENFHNSGDLEKNIDYTLSFFSHICYLRNNRIISATDFDHFKYELARIIRNRQFVEYMYNLYHFSQYVNQPISFVGLFEYAQKNHCFDTEFWNKDSVAYPCYLNFRNTDC